jgi:hypothetical protein
MKRMLVRGGSSLLMILVSTWCGSVGGAEASGSDPLAGPLTGQPAVKPDARLLKRDAMFARMQTCVDRTQRMPSPYDDAFLANALCALHVATREVN